ncbi:MAG TPA: helix-turn-helix domain-containing protein [Gemmatimonadales bacterium]|nr:helix-turn-helix domain-containing protein [Gemmatimonadales bacterium]
MPGARARVFSREFKEAAVRRILAGEKVKALAAELHVWPKLLYHWWDRYEWGGAEALVPPGRPPRSAVWAQRPRPAPKRARKPRQKRGTPEEAAAAARVAELERKVGQQALELDFFARALRHVKASARANDGRGAGASSP